MPPKTVVRTEPAPSVKAAETVAPSPIVRAGLPLRLQVPAIKVDAAVEALGVTANGDMATPNGPVNVGWYKLGVRPGEIGSAVIDGHFGWANNVPAVFDRLHQLSIGAKLLVTDDQGVPVSFVVKSFRRFKENDNATAIFTSGDGRAHLNLITCTGVWNKVSGRFPDRLVVFADKE